MRVTNSFADSWRPSVSSSGVLSIAASTVSHNLKCRDATGNKICLLPGTDRHSCDEMYLEEGSC